MHFFFFHIATVLTISLGVSSTQNDHSNANTCARAVTSTNARPVETIRRVSCSPIFVFFSVPLARVLSEESNAT